MIQRRPQPDPTPAQRMPRAIALALAVACGLGSVMTARSHPGHAVEPCVELEIRIETGHVDFSAFMPLADFLREVVGCATLGEFKALAAPELAARVQGYMAKENPVHVDGLRVLPVFSKHRIDFFDPPKPDQRDLAREVAQVDFEVRYELKTEPRRIAFQWNKFLRRPLGNAGVPPGTGLAKEVVDDVVALVVFEGRSTLTAFGEHEREYIWHSRGTPRPPATALAAPRPVRATVSLPVASLALLLAAAGVAWARLPHGGTRRERFTTVAATLGVAALLGPYGHVQAPLPWERKLSPPEPEAALDLFRALHANIYRAFDHLRETDIYDTLAQSVDGPLLERVYGDVYQALILRDEGGAVCRVQAVDLREATLLTPEEAIGPPQPTDGFRVRAKWRVRGMVRHWGHTHERTHAYEAVYALAPRAGAWRIVGSTVLAQEPVESDEPTPDSKPAPRPDAQAAPGVPDSVNSKGGN